MPTEYEALKVADIIVAILNGSAIPADIPVPTMRQNIMINQETMTAIGIILIQLYGELPILCRGRGRIKNK